MAIEYKCFRCGHELCIEGNEMIDLFDGEEVMNTYAHCLYCGASYELMETPESEKKNYPYWNEEDEIMDEKEKEK